MKLLTFVLTCVCGISAQAALVTRSVFNAATNTILTQVASKQDQLTQNSNITVSNITSKGYLTLSGETNRLTVADGALKLDGTALQSVIAATSTVTLSNLNANGLIRTTGSQGAGNVFVGSGGDSSVDIYADDESSYINITDVGVGLNLQPADGVTPFLFNATIPPSETDEMLKVTSTNGIKFAVHGRGSIRTQGGTASTPANASATGTAGTILWDSGFIYICVAANTWKRVAIATW